MKVLSYDRSRDGGAHTCRFWSLSTFSILLFLIVTHFEVEQALAQNPVSVEGNTGLPIDRQALVTRHNPVIRIADPLNPLSLGNGEFAFTADLTGLQSFPEFYRGDVQSATGLPGSIPLATLSHWGWHTFPNPDEYELADALVSYKSQDREIGYASDQNSPAGQWLRQNPHRLNLGRIGFEFYRKDGTRLAYSDLENTEQRLDLWSGTLRSQFSIEETPVVVYTWVHPEVDLVAVEIDAPKLTTGQIGVQFEFPYGSGAHTGDGADWDRPDAHRTIIVNSTEHETTWKRELDKETFYIRVIWAGEGVIAQRSEHHYTLKPGDPGSLRFVVAFSSEAFNDDLPLVEDTREASRVHWESFWISGGAVDLSGSTDPRAPELERRIVLSQYLTAIHSAGSLPPQETGLAFNSWYGKYHLEMHWWHAVHFALWGRTPLLEKSLWWYQHILPEARQTASRQGYQGARWPKMVGPDGIESPSGVGVFLIWQQPHPIYYAELLHREQGKKETLERYQEIVEETADFMASFAAWDERSRTYHLGPPLIPAQESHPPESTLNPPFELSYWRYGLETAQQWRLRSGLLRHPDWDRVLENLASLPVRDSLYINASSAPETFLDPRQRRDHPTLLAACGMVPCNGADPEIMRRTLKRVMESWDWESTWGWDYPMIAMTAARVGEPEIAIESLLMKTTKNTYLENGHNYQRNGLTIYLPGNGGLLAAIAMMGAGWDGAPDLPAPGFPRNGQWVVRSEGLHRIP